MIDRIGLSRKNGWIDEKDRVYIFFTLDDIMEQLHCAKEKASKLISELNAVGLIETKRQGLGRANIIYVKDCNS
jgi:DNA-binding transcriptional regulator GbsR (MarR family)